MPIVQIKNPGGAVVEQTLGKNNNVIGRDPSCDVVLDDPQVSRRHAAIMREGDAFWIKDLDSTNGTILNGVPVTSAELSDADMLRVGGHVMIYRSDVREERSDEPEMTIRFITQKSQKTVERLSAAELSVIEHVNRKIASMPTVEEMINFVFQQMRELVPCDRMGIAFIEENGRRIRSYHTAAIYEPVLLKTGFAQDLTDSSLEAIIETGRPRIIDDLSRYLTEHPGSRSTRLIVDEGLRSSMTCPLSVDGRNVGVLFWSSRKAYAFRNHHIDVHDSVVERLSQGFEKAYRFEQLKAANEAYFEVLGFVAHELKSPISTIVTMARTMIDGYAGPVSDKHKNLLERMTGKGEYLLGLIKEYLNLAHIEGGDLKLAAVPTASFSREIVEPALEIVQAALDEKKMVLTRKTRGNADDGVWDKELLKIVVLNLLGNAAKYGDEGGEIRLETVADPSEVFVSVWNTGPGFPSDQQERLFRKFSRLNTKELMKRKGTGLGLYTTWKIVNQHGGHISAASKEGEWAEFSFRIPRHPAHR